MSEGLKVVQFERRPAPELREWRSADGEAPKESGYYFARQKGFSRIEPVEVVMSRLPGCGAVPKVFCIGAISARPVEMFHFFGRVPRIEEG